MSVIAKKFDSLRQEAGNGYIIRLIFTSDGLVDKRWVEDLGINRNNLPAFILVKYPDTHERYLPENVRGTPHWDDETYNELNLVCPSNKFQTDKQKPEKFEEAMKKFRSCNKDFLTFNDYSEALVKYIEWCKKYCKVVIKENSFKGEQ